MMRRDDDDDDDAHSSYAWVAEYASLHLWMLVT